MAEATQATKAVILSIVRSVEAAPQLGVPEFVPTTKSEIFYRASSYFLDQGPDVNGAVGCRRRGEARQLPEHDYNERHLFFLPAVMTTSGTISGDFLRLLYILSHRQAANYFTHAWASLTHPPWPSSNAEARTYTTIELPSAKRVPRPLP